MAKVHFLGGLPRAGSTMLINLLGQNPCFNVTPTSGLVDVLQGMSRGFTNSVFVKADLEQDVMKERLYSSCKSAIDGWYARETGPVIDKSRGWLPQWELLTKMYDSPKIIAPIRDLRGCLTSMEKLWRDRPEYRANQPESWGTIEGRVQDWLTGAPLGSAASFIKDAVRRGYAKDILFVRLEDLCDNPQREINKIYDYLGEVPYEHDFQNIKQITQEHDSLHEPFGFHQLKEGPITPVKKDWEEMLGRQVSANVVQGNDWFYRMFYPEVM